MTTMYKNCGFGLNLLVCDSFFLQYGDNYRSIFKREWYDPELFQVRFQRVLWYCFLEVC